MIGSASSNDSLGHTKTHAAGSSESIIIGAGPAGLACAAAIKAAGLECTILEQADSVGSAWRQHYDRLHLHTDRNHSGLPGLRMPRTYPRYPSRAQVVSYLEAYADKLSISPCFSTRVDRVHRKDGVWIVEAGARRLEARVVVIATGLAGLPYKPMWPGTDIFRGSIVHSSAYRNAASYVGKRALVVGFGNSGGEIALDLAEAGVDVTLSIRGPVQLLPRDLLGLPILTWAVALRPLPARFVDALTAPLIRLALGPIAPVGLRRAHKGPRCMVEEDGKVPLLDIGTLAAIRRGEIKVRGAIHHLEADGVAFADYAIEPFDLIVSATGYRCDLRPLLPSSPSVLDAGGKPLVTGGVTGVPGLYFCGQTIVPTGQLREIGIEARRIAALAKKEIVRDH